MVTPGVVLGQQDAYSAVGPKLADLGVAFYPTMTVYKSRRDGTGQTMVCRDVLEKDNDNVRIRRQ